MSRSVDGGATWSPAKAVSGRLTHYAMSAYRSERDGRERVSVLTMVDMRGTERLYGHDHGEMRERTGIDIDAVGRRHADGALPLRLGRRRRELGHGDVARRAVAPEPAVCRRHADHVQPGGPGPRDSRGPPPRPLHPRGTGHRRARRRNRQRLLPRPSPVRLGRPLQRRSGRDLARRRLHHGLPGQRSLRRLGPRGRGAADRAPAESAGQVSGAIALRRGEPRPDAAHRPYLRRLRQDLVAALPRRHQRRPLPWHAGPLRPAPALSIPNGSGLAGAGRSHVSERRRGAIYCSDDEGPHLAPQGHRSRELLVQHRGAL